VPAVESYVEQVLRHAPDEVRVVEEAPPEEPPQDP
jgi:hypothetical protein